MAGIISIELTLCSLPLEEGRGEDAQRKREKRNNRRYFLHLANPSPQPSPKGRGSFLLLSNHIQHVCKQFSVRRDRIPSVDGSFAAPIGESSTGLFNDWQQRGTIPNVHHRIEHEVGAAGGHEHVTVSVTPSSARMNSLPQSLRSLPKSELFTRAEVRRQEQSFIE